MVFCLDGELPSEVQDLIKQVKRMTAMLKQPQLHSSVSLCIPWRHILIMQVRCMTQDGGTREMEEKQRLDPSGVNPTK